MSCRNARLLMSARLDNDIAPEDVTRLEDHLADCPHCDLFWQAMSAAGTVVREDVPFMLRHDFTDRVMSSIEALTSPVFQPPAWRKWSAVAAALSLVFALTVAPVLAAIITWRLSPGTLTGISSWYANLSRTVSHWLSVVSDSVLDFTQPVQQAIAGGGGVVALGCILVLTGAFLTSYIAIWTKYQGAVTRA